MKSLRIIALLLAAATPLGIVAAQDEESESPTPFEKITPEYPVVEVDSVVMEQFTPQHVSAKDLHYFAVNMLGRKFQIRERGTKGGVVMNMNLIGDTIVLYDERSAVDRILKRLGDLDHPPQDVQHLQLLEYRPRYLSLAAVDNALRPFRHLISTDTSGRSRGGEQNISYVEDRALVIVRDTEKVLGEIKSLLTRIDVPDPQVVLTLHVIQGTTEEITDESLPGELRENLQQLLPRYRFRSLGMAMIRTSVAPGRRVLLNIPGGPTDGYSMEFEPVAYDQEATTLSIEKCSVRRELFRTVQTVNGMEHGRMGIDELFTTNTTIRGGEYTVLGATGQDPVFLVLRLVPVRQ